MAPRKFKEPVRIRTKKLADGSESYYLDIYVDGIRTYEFLKLYRLPETNPRIREQNRATYAAVEAIKSKRILEIINGKAGLRNVRVRSKILMLDWMQIFLRDQERRGVRGVSLLKTVIRILTIYDQKKKVRMRDINKMWCRKFLDWLRNVYKTRLGKPLTPKSQADYVCYFSTALNAAVRSEIISENPFLALESHERIKVPDSRREFLTIDEIKKLIDTDCPREDVKRAYLFSCYCGLRLSDVYGLRWKDLSKDGEQWRASVIMQKTTTPIFLPLSNQAMKWLPDRPEDAKDDDKVFAGLCSDVQINKILKDWTKAAGITKHITFHTSRHTFATMMLTLGADLYVTSKLLGHANVETTQIYAKIVDSKKVDAVNLVDDVFD